MNTNEQYIKTISQSNAVSHTAFDIAEVSVADTTTGATLCHTAGDGYIFDYLLQGEGQLCYGDVTLTLSKGDICYTNSTTTTTFHAESGNTLHMFRVVIHGTFANRLIAAFDLGAVYVAHVEAKNIFTEIHDIFEQSFSVCSTQKLMMISRLLFALLTEMKKESLFSDSSFTMNTAAKIKNYIDANIYNDICLDNITAEFGITKMHIIRLYKKDYGTTPMQYLINRRTEIAKSLLADTKIPIKEISNILRYSNTQHFSNSFKKYVGISPKQYRQAKK